MLIEPLQAHHRRALDNLLSVTPEKNLTWLTWLRQSPAKPNSRYVREHRCIGWGTGRQSHRLSAYPSSSRRRDGRISYARGRCRILQERAALSRIRLSGSVRCGTGVAPGTRLSLFGRVAENCGPAANRARSDYATHSHHASSAMTRAVRSFNEQLERLLELTMVVVTRAMLPFVTLSANIWWLIPLLFLVLRPLSVFAGLAGQPIPLLQLVLMSWFGIRGIGSVFLSCVRSGAWRSWRVRHPADRVYADNSRCVHNRARRDSRYAHGLVQKVRSGLTLLWRYDGMNGPGKDEHHPSRALFSVF